MCVCLHTNGPLKRERKRRAFFFFFHDISGIRLMALGGFGPDPKKEREEGTLSSAHTIYEGTISISCYPIKRYTSSLCSRAQLGKLSTLLRKKFKGKTNVFLTILS